MKPISCFDNDCNRKLDCYRWHGEGVSGQIKHGVDPDGNIYCNYFLTKELYEKILNGVEKLFAGESSG